MGHESKPIPMRWIEAEDTPTREYTKLTISIPTTHLKDVPIELFNAGRLVNVIFREEEYRPNDCLIFKSARYGNIMVPSILAKQVKAVLLGIHTGSQIYVTLRLHPDNTQEVVTLLGTITVKHVNIDPDTIILNSIETFLEATRM